MIKSRGFEKPPKSKTAGNQKPPTALFKAPKKLEVIQLLNVTDSIFQKQFKAYQKAAGMAVRACRVAETIQEMRELYSDDPINELMMERDDE